MYNVSGVRGLRWRCLKKFARRLSRKIRMFMATLSLRQRSRVALAHTHTYTGIDTPARAGCVLHVANLAGFLCLTALNFGSVCSVGVCECV